MPAPLPGWRAASALRAWLSWGYSLRVARAGDVGGHGLAVWLWRRGKARLSTRVFRYVEWEDPWGIGGYFRRDFAGGHQALPHPPGTLRPELGPIALGCLCLVGTNAFSLAIPWLLKQAIDALRALAPAAAHGVVVRDAVPIIVFAVLQALIRT